MSQGQPQANRGSRQCMCYPLLRCPACCQVPPLPNSHLQHAVIAAQLVVHDGAVPLLADHLEHLLPGSHAWAAGFAAALGRVGDDVADVPLLGLGAWLGLAAAPLDNALTVLLVQRIHGGGVAGAPLRLGVHCSVAGWEVGGAGVNTGIATAATVTCTAWLAILPAQDSTSPPQHITDLPGLSHLRPLGCWLPPPAPRCPAAPKPQRHAPSAAAAGAAGCRMGC